jgi:hypothetical protein
VVDYRNVVGITDSEVVFFRTLQQVGQDLYWFCWMMYRWRLSGQFAALRSNALRKIFLRQSLSISAPRGW